MVGRAAKLPDHLTVGQLLKQRASPVLYVVAVQDGAQQAGNKDE
jgi:hypothetical protein